ncbi:Putative rhodanese-related sulfurtransferase [Candidatus Glomeribacter gigasporarum BEG34]|uniref:Putative rhodanese-related sulfurtransferase n=1 Tax=Candidatus Glomeribacter gigasporarum BEG34 TaxID=1070319 RepID=G2J8A1_9BURK|nr:Putative rhodanese-related sulfurtransferase [Candidatus Glomeribacter gigasporarum BEG34]
MNLILIAAAAISGALLVWPMLTRRARALSIAQATQLINRRNALVIDVRSADEYQCGHLPRARRIGLDELQSRIARIAKNKNHPVLLVCQTGVRTRRAEATLKQMGYTEVFGLQGGLAAWQAAGLPLVQQ